MMREGSALASIRNFIIAVACPRSTQLAAYLGTYMLRAHGYLMFSEDGGKGPKRKSSHDGLGMVMSMSLPHASLQIPRSCGN